MIDFDWFDDFDWIDLGIAGAFVNELVDKERERRRRREDDLEQDDED